MSARRSRLQKAIKTRNLSVREVYYYAYSAYRRADFEQCATTENYTDFWALNEYRDVAPFSSAINKAYSVKCDR